MQLFPDVRPDQKSGADYFRDALDLAEEPELITRLLGAYLTSSEVMTAAAREISLRLGAGQVLLPC